MEPEFLDPGPDQPPPPPYGPPTAAAPTGRRTPLPGLPAGPPARPAGRRESAGLVVMLVASAVLAAVAAQQTLYSVVEQNVVARSAFAVDAWGDYQLTDGPELAGHAPRFGVLLTLVALAFCLLALMAAILLLGRRSPRPAWAAAAVASAAIGLVGVLVGITAAMTLEIQSSFAQYQSAAGVLEVRMRVGGAVWLALAGVLAGGLSVTAALRVRKAFQAPPFGY